MDHEVGLRVGPQRVLWPFVQPGKMGARPQKRRRRQRKRRAAMLNHSTFVQRISYSGMEFRKDASVPCKLLYLARLAAWLNRMSLSG